MKKSLYTFLFFLFTTQLYGQSEGAEVDSIKEKILLAKGNKQLTGLYNDLAWEYSFTNYDSAAKYTQMALEKARDIDSPYWIAVSTEMKALLMEISGKPEEAITLYMSVIDIRQNQLNGDGLENTYNNLAILLKSQKNYEKAYEYFRKSYEIERQNSNKEGIAGSLINMGIALKDLGLRDSSIVLMREASNIAGQINNQYLITNANLNIADHFKSHQEYDSALYYYNQVIGHSEKTGDNNGLTTALVGIAGVYYASKDYKKALSYLERGEAHASQINTLEYLKRAYELYKDIYKALGIYDKAFDYQEKYIAANDSIINKETVSVLNELEKKYETAEKEKQITTLELENQTTALQLEKSENQRNIFIFSTAIVLILAGFIGYLFYAKGKVNKILEHKNTVIEQALDEKEILLKEIHHRVKNNLQVISSLLNLQSRHIKDTNAAEAIKEGKNRVKSMAMIHQKLYQKDNLTGIDIDDYFENLINSLFDSYGVDRNKIKLNMDIDPVRLDVDTTIPLGLILNELISNILKHAFENNTGGKVDIKLKHTNEHLELKIADNGKGMPEEIKQESFGMKLVESLAQKLKATTSIESTHGTCYIVNISKFKLV